MRYPFPLALSGTIEKESMPDHLKKTYRIAENRPHTIAGLDEARLRLQRQAWLAAALLFSPWLAAVLFYWPLFLRQPLGLLMLLPGLAVAVYLQQQLWRNLGGNHRHGEEDCLFSTLGAATWVTLLRATVVVALAGFLPLTFQHGQAQTPALLWIPGLLYLGIGMADLLDGFLARKLHRETELGKQLDIETDAAGLLVASLVAISLGRLPVLYLLVGLAYYTFICGIWWRQQRRLPLVSLQSRPYSRIIAGFQMGLVALALLPILRPVFIFLAAFLCMTPLLAGFIRDWLVVSGRIATGCNQQTSVDHWAGLVLTQWLPVALRLVILSSGVVILAGSEITTTGPVWRWVLGLCCLLIGGGWMGRSCALFLSLVLSCGLSPFGTTNAALTLFCATTTLMLTGSGIFSLWSPEDTLLYRRNQDGMEQGCQNP